MSELAQRIIDAEYVVPPLDPLVAALMLAEADSWLGTRFVHQGKIKGLGVDCAQFIAALVRAGGREIQISENYGRQEDGRIMIRALLEHGNYVPEAQMSPADMIAFCDEAQRAKDKPRHLALVRELAPHTTFIIHASEHGVRRHRINMWWRGRIHSVWRLRPS